MKFDFSLLNKQCVAQSATVCFPLISRAGSSGTGLREREGPEPGAQGAASDEETLRGGPALPGGRKTDGCGHRLRRGRKHRGTVLRAEEQWEETSWRKHTGPVVTDGWKEGGRERGGEDEQSKNWDKRKSKVKKERM